MKSPLSSLLVISALCLSTICEAQVISLTQNFTELMTVTERATLSVLGYCVSQLNFFCRLPKHHRRNYSSLEERITSQDNDALQYDPSTVEKLEATIGPQEKRSLRNSFKEDLSPSILQSPSNQQQQRFLRYKTFLYPTVNHKNRPLFSILFRPVMNAWSAMVGATTTFFNTVTLAHTSMEYVKETTSTTTLFACINDLENSAILNEFPKCPKLSNLENSNPESPYTLTIPITVDDSSTANIQIDSFAHPIILSPIVPESLPGNIPDETVLEETLEDETATDTNTMSGETSTLLNWSILPTTPYTASHPVIPEHPSQSTTDPTTNNGCSTCCEWINKVQKIMLFALEFSPPIQ